MGIPDLVRWVQKFHPGSTRSFPRRWSDRNIAGKKVAIDATLLTNAFHFGRLNSVEPGLEGRGAVIGWYHLITSMRAAGVQPIAIWDEKGPRAWKAAEAHRRLALRALILARRNHEIERVERLEALRSAISTFNAMPSTDQKMIRKYWADNEWSSLGPNLDKTSLSAAADTPILSSTATLLLAFNRSKISSKGSAEDMQEVSEAIDHIRDLEALRQSDPVIDPRVEEEVGEIDEKLQELVPADVFSESPRQMELTREEGEILDKFLGAEPVEETKVDKSKKKKAPVGEEAITPDERDVDERLDDLIFRAPELRDSYTKSLDLPTQKDHADCRKLLVKMGVPVLEAKIPYEAEGLASSLALAGLVDYVGTEDSDVLAYEGPLLRGLGSERRPLVVISGSHLRSLTALSSSSFLDFCILLGTDASPRIPQIGPQRAFPLIKKYGTIEKMLANEPKIASRLTDQSAFLEMVNNARKVFRELPPLPENVELVQGIWDEGDVARYLEEKHGIRFVERKSMILEDQRESELDAAYRGMTTPSKAWEVVDDWDREATLLEMDGWIEGEGEDDFRGDEEIPWGEIIAEEMERMRLDGE